MPSATTRRARQLRQAATKHEWMLWTWLRGRRLGVRFRRQHPVGPYFADFACISERVIVEVDGESHREAYDAHRDAWLKARGWRVFHVPVQDIDEHVDDVVGAIHAFIHRSGSDSLYEIGPTRSATPTDLPAKRGGESLRGGESVGPRARADGPGASR